MAVQAVVVPAYAQVSLRNRAVANYPAWDGLGVCYAEPDGIVVAARPENEGTATVRVASSEEQLIGPMSSVCETSLVTDGGLLLGNPSTSEWAFRVEPGACRVRVFVDEPTLPQTILFLLDGGFSDFESCAESAASGAVENDPERTDQVLRRASIGAPLAEQRRVGARLHRFFASNGIRPGDKFEVRLA